jgi:uncharacterized protein (TIGR02996 family)
MRLVRTDGHEKRETWEILLAGKTVTTIAKAHRQNAKRRTLRYGSPAKAQQAYDAMIAQQRAAGFRAIGEIDPPAIPIARDAELEAAIREDRADPAPYLVYADWLLERGSPLGEMLMLAQRPKQARRVTALAKQVGLPSPDMATFGARHGLWQWLRIENEDDWMDGAFDVRPFARALFGSPLCAALEELRVGIIRWDHNHEDVPAVVEEAGRHAWARDLARLHLGDVPHNIDMAHHVIGDVGRPITKAFPHLVSLKLHSGEQRWRTKKETFGIGGLALPHLRELVIETCALTRARVKALTTAELPALERLELWFGAHDHDSDALAIDLAPLLDGKRLPHLAHLALRNSELGSELAGVLAASAAAPRLVTLDLSMGTLDDTEAAALAAHARRFPKLTRLTVDDTYVTRAGVRALRAAFTGVEVSAADRKEPYEWDPGARFVSVAE